MSIPNPQEVIAAALALPFVRGAVEDQRWEVERASVGEKKQDAIKELTRLTERQRVLTDVVTGWLP